MQPKLTCVLIAGILTVYLLHGLVYESIYDLTHIGQKYAILGPDFIIVPTIMELSRNTIPRIWNYFNTCVNYRFYIANGSIIRHKIDRLEAV